MNRLYGFSWGNKDISFSPQHGMFFCELKGSAKVELLGMRVGQ